MHEIDTANLLIGLDDVRIGQRLRVKLHQALANLPVALQRTATAISEHKNA